MRILPRVAFWLGVSLFLAGEARAGIFNLYHFVPSGEFALGMEADLTLSNGTGIAANVKYTQGLNELMNFSGFIGTGGGPRGFRFGGDLVFDFFPDIQGGQPGIGLAVQGMYIRTFDIGNFEATAIPYLHKTFVSGKNEVEPFFSFPFGLRMRSDGVYVWPSTVVVGAMFRGSDRVRYVLELGVNVANSETYCSGGLTYYH